MIFKFILLIILILLNGIFSATEIALLSLNKYKIYSKENDTKAKKIKSLLDNPSNFLATIQIGITIAGFLASAFAAETFSDSILSIIGGSIPISITLLKSIVVIVVTVILSYFTLVLGELVPKKLALKYPEKISYLMVDFILILMKFSYPFVWILTKSTNIITNALKINLEVGDSLTEEEIKMMILRGREEGIIEAKEKDMLLKVFEFNDIKVKDIMNPKSSIVSIDITANKNQIYAVLKQCKYTRYPIYSKNTNNIVGILNIKDIIDNYDKTDFSIEVMMRTPFYTLDTEYVDDLFKVMQNEKEVMAIVKNINNEVVGILTIEDIIEEIVGNIFNEHDNK